MKSIVFVFGFLAVFSPTPADSAEDAPKVVFLTGDEEYRSEESMPMLANILRRDFGFRVSVGFSVNEEGFVDPNAADSLTGTEDIADADLLVLFLRFRRPDDATFKRILAHLQAGKPVIAFRTATHAFRFAKESPYAEWGYQSDPTFQHSFAGGKLMRDLVGQKWLTHHGHFADGSKPLTAVTLNEEQTEHPILRGVEPFEAYSWLYHVQGGGDTIEGQPQVLLNGKSLRSRHAEKGNEKRYPINNPVAWTRTHNWGKQPARVFTTTLGHPYDFKIPAMRRFALQAILWTMGQEKLIPESGVKTTIVGEYQPNNSGFGKTYKQGLKPNDLFTPSGEEQSSRPNLGSGRE